MEPRWFVTGEKLKYFQAFVLSKLRYGLCTCWLTKTQKRRLEGFHARCLRRIMGILPAFLSRVSNTKVFTMAKVQPVTTQLLIDQLMLLGRVGRADAQSPLRRDTLWKGTAEPVVGKYVRRIGRPRQDWTTQVLAEAEKIAGSRAALEALLADKTPAGPQRWRKTFK